MPSVGMRVCKAEFLGHAPADVTQMVLSRARQSNLSCSFSASNVASGTPYFSPWWDNLAKDFITLENEAPINNVPIIWQMTPLRAEIWCI